MAKSPRKIIKFWWLLPGIYLLIVTVLILGMVIGAGHTPRVLDLLFYVLIPPCFILDRLLTRAAVPNILLNSLACLAAGLLMYTTIGALIDFGIARYWRRRKQPQ